MCACSLVCMWACARVFVCVRVSVCLCAHACLRECVCGFVYVNVIRLLYMCTGRKAINKLFKAIQFFS